MTMSTHRISRVASQHGFHQSDQCVCSDPESWIKDSEGGGSVSVRPGKNGVGWIVASFGPNRDIPLESRWFPRFEWAFQHAAA